MGAAHDRSRPAAVRRRGDRRAGPRRAASSPGGARFCAQTARRARSVTENPRIGHGPGRPRRAIIWGVSNLDGLDGFEAEAELRLKKACAAVVDRCRYCVLAQDATYGGNKLGMKYIPQANY